MAISFCIEKMFNATNIKRSVKRRSVTDVTNIGTINIDYFVPNFEQELALHSKKLVELKNWLCSKMSVTRGSKTMLLTGPSGSGKKTALRVLCFELGIEVTEWDCADEYMLDFSNEHILRRSSMNSFLQFLQNTEFNSIQRMSLKHRLLLIAQLPSSLLREPKQLHTILAEIVRNSRCIVVFVLPNTDSCWELSPIRLFPATVLELLNIAHIKFNPISSTLMASALKRVCQMSTCHYNADLIKNIINASFGDIRRAVNDLLLHQQTTKRHENGQKNKQLRLGRNSNSPRQQKQPGAIQSANNKCATLVPQSDQLELFHYIGKMMYAKRSPTVDKHWQMLEAKLHPGACKKYARPFPPKDDLNKLIDMSPISSRMLTDYLFEHEPRFAPSLHALSRIANTVAELDAIVGNNFEQQLTMEKYQMDLTIRSSLLYNYRANSSRVPSYRFYQFEQPKSREFHVRQLETRVRIAELYPTNERSAEMATLILPLLARIHHIPINKSQLELLQRLSFASSIANTLSMHPIIPISTTEQQQLADPDMIAQLEMLDAVEDDIQSSSNVSFNSSSRYSICSQQHQQQSQEIEDGNECGEDGFNYDIDERE